MFLDTDVFCMNSPLGFTQNIFIFVSNNVWFEKGTFIIMLQIFNRCQIGLTQAEMHFFLSFCGSWMAYFQSCCCCF